jgi:hypothetical protein
MGSGVNRRWWSDQGTRGQRRANTKTRKQAGVRARLKVKALRAEAKRRASDGRVA